MDAISLTQHSFVLRRANQAVNGEPVASKGCTAGLEREMGKHACRKAGRCALSLLYGVAAGWATAPPTMTWAPIDFTHPALFLKTPQIPRNGLPLRRTVAAKTYGPR
jgi:hypothetical protein